MAEFNDVQVPPNLQFLIIFDWLTHWLIDLLIEKVCKTTKDYFIFRG